jgi:hypothetical protein
MVKARQVMQWMAPVLALGVAGVVPLETMVQRTSSLNVPSTEAAHFKCVKHDPCLEKGLAFISFFRPKPSIFSHESRERRPE